ncbi:ABC transporter permease subunit [Alkalibaculum sp. M08DMB]|uniref:ABC transporter permease subunit n=1 Tax=Alkalibaculum sporogenes TaxID=2655001 RepID=A0A6A7KA41_9FIRM|nr:methionine ABC transporter permease [Alkalibaculum sporogenes]MPW26181.1 ABC transporter permease subunit [Alkalibaculum sporogenes]
MWNSTIMTMISLGLLETLYMTLVGTFIAYLIGLPLGILVVVTEKGSILPAKWLNSPLNSIINITRSIPFLILLITVMPFTRFVIGTTYGSTATIVPLVISAAPFIARMVESSIKEVDKGVIEAALSMGASPFQIICRVMITEAKPSLIIGYAIITTTVLGYSAMAGIVGGGGLGDIAIRYGYHRGQTDIMIVTVVLLVLVVQLLQEIGMRTANKQDKRK